MDKLKLVDKLREKANITYEEAKIALENSNWDILDAMLYLERCEKISSPSVSIFYSNQYKESYANNDITNNNNVITSYNYKENYKSKNNSNGIFEKIFEVICRIIDNGNNMFLQIKKSNRILVNIPLTVVAVLLFFSFGVVILLTFLGMFFNIEFSISSKRFDTNKIDKVNKAINSIQKAIQSIKEKGNK